MAEKEYIERERIEKLFDGIYDCADLTFEPNDHCCSADDCGHCKWYETKNAIKKRILSIPAADVGWIPVTERLPELHDAEYLDEATGELVRYKESMPVLIWLAKGGFMDIGIYEKSDAVDDFCYQGIPHTVTYWMPLPDAPEEGE